MATEEKLQVSGMEMFWRVAKPLGPQVSDTTGLEIISLTMTEDS